MEWVINDIRLSDFDSRLGKGFRTYQEGENYKENYFHTYPYNCLNEMFSTETKIANLQRKLTIKIILTTRNKE